MTTKPDIVLFEDPEALRLAPPAAAHPVFDLTVGACTSRARLEELAGRPVECALVRPELAALLAPRGLRDARAAAPEGEGRPALLVNGAALLDARLWEAVLGLGENERLVNDQGALIAFGHRADRRSCIALVDGSLSFDAEGFATRILPGARVLRHLWDLIAFHESILREDLERRIRAGAGAAGGAGSPGAPLAAVESDVARGIRIHGNAVYCAAGSALEGPLVCDARQGPILIGRDVVVAPFSVLEGPLCVAEGARILGGRVAASFIGPGCRVRGEIETCVFSGWVNKAHEGYVGHSYVGEWVNLGALTTTSDLKNNYRPIHMWEEGARRSTDLIKLGSFIGDHAKTAIGTLLGAGSVIGVGTSLHGAGGRASRRLPAFLWGEGRDAAEYDWERFQRTCEHVLARRGRAWTSAEQEVLRGVFDRTECERRAWLAEERSGA